MADFNRVSLDNFHFEQFIFTFNRGAGLSATTAPKTPVSLDTSGPNKVKAGADGDRIFGLVESSDAYRATHGVAVKFAQALKVKSGDALAIGDTAVCAGNGEIKKATTANPNDNIVVELRTGGLAVVVKY